MKKGAGVLYFSNRSILVVALFMAVISVCCFGCSSGGSGDSVPEQEQGQEQELGNVSLNRWAVSPSTLDSTVNNGKFDIEWEISFSSDFNYYDFTFYIIENEQITYDDFQDGVYTGKGVKIDSWGYNRPATSAKKSFVFNSELNEIQMTGVTGQRRIYLGSLTGTVYALGVVRIYDAQMSPYYGYDIFEIELISDPSEPEDNSAEIFKAIAENRFSLKYKYNDTLWMLKINPYHYSSNGNIYYSYDSQYTTGTWSVEGNKINLSFTGDNGEFEFVKIENNDIFLRPLTQSYSDLSDTWKLQFISQL